MADESDVQLLTGGAGPLIRTINVTTMINGTATVVQMEVAAISDEYGNIIDSFADYNQQTETNLILKGILYAICQIAEIEPSDALLWAGDM